jgi:hypothetical protein
MRVAYDPLEEEEEGMTGVGIGGAAAMAAVLEPFPFVVPPPAVLVLAFAGIGADALPDLLPCAGAATVGLLDVLALTGGAAFTKPLALFSFAAGAAALLLAAAAGTAEAWACSLP